MAALRRLLVLLLLTVALHNAKGESALESYIRKIIENMKPQVEEIDIQYIPTINTGNQDYGKFDVQLNNTIIHGFGEFNLTNLEAPLIPLSIKNITIFVPIIDVTADYYLNGMFNWPLGDDFPVYGKGPLNAILQGVTISISVTLKHDENFDIVANKVGFYMDVENIQVNLGNLMDGGSLGDMFNSLIDDVIMDVFQFYKPGFMEKMKPVVAAIINEMLKQFIP